MSVSELIEQLVGKEGDAAKGWALTEVMEQGCGVFEKVSNLLSLHDGEGMELI